ncbi:MAG: S-adenosylmethionine:tRNA ribosyltransferase-isomerase, partial [Myxococcota bacterium]
MRPATDPRRAPRHSRLLHIRPGLERFTDRCAPQLARLLRRGDLLVVNDAATLPASLQVEEGLELRLLSMSTPRRWRAVLFGVGDWRTDTDARPAPPAVRIGQTLRLQGGLSATVEGISPLSPRLLSIRFETSADAIWSQLYRLGRPIQYAYLQEPVPLWAVQNVYARRPWSVEMPSAGRILTWSVLSSLRQAGVQIARL